ncbi:Carbohydrate-binding protein [Phytophthora megakarya]|uniref:Carbohydrate-binding protein n=1 Tax=Phytophthora megakarya TaxID=4795 RepID=A0A225VID7_9STRA|nr:Carbohydrate-binding protein [Phytophthora megakarya]
MTARGRALQVLALSALTLQARGSTTSDFCSSVTSCLKDGSTACDTTTGECPPCIYALDSMYTCWEKDNSTNTCPFTGVRYDCSDSWSTTASSSSTASASSTNSTEDSATSTPSSASSSTSTVDTSSSSSGLGGLSSSLITYGAIGLGTVLVVVILGILCARRRKMRRRREENIAATGAGNFGRNRVMSDKRPRGLSKRDEFSSGPYNNILDTSKVNYTTSNYNAAYGYGHRKASRDDQMDSLSRVPTDESPRSFDGMLTDPSQSPAMLGDSSHNSRGSQRSGGRNTPAPPVVGGIGGFNEYVQQDVTSRCTSTPNVFGEYLRMKQEMQYDEPDRSTEGDIGGVSFSDTISDLDSGKYSFASSQGINRLPPRRTDLDGRSSMADSITDSIPDSVTDSEYAEQVRARGESDCFSEMSYNDEKYSFSSLDGLDDSQVREGKREVEI